MRTGRGIELLDWNCTGGAMREFLLHGCDVNFLSGKGATGAIPRLSCVMWSSASAGKLEWRA